MDETRKVTLETRGDLFISNGMVHCRPVVYKQPGYAMFSSKDKDGSFTYDPVLLDGSGKIGKSYLSLVDSEMVSTKNISLVTNDSVEQGKITKVSKPTPGFSSIVCFVLSSSGRLYRMGDYEYHPYFADANISKEKDLGFKLDREITVPGNLTILDFAFHDEYDVRQEILIFLTVDGRLWIKKNTEIPQELLPGVFFKSLHQIESGLDNYASSQTILGLSNDGNLYRYNGRELEYYFSLPTTDSTIVDVSMFAYPGADDFLVVLDSKGRLNSPLFGNRSVPIKLKKILPQIHQKALQGDFQGVDLSPSSFYEESDRAKVVLTNAVKILFTIDGDRMFNLVKDTRGNWFHVDAESVNTEDCCYALKIDILKDCQPLRIVRELGDVCFRWYSAPNLPKYPSKIFSIAKYASNFTYLMRPDNEKRAMQYLGIEYLPRIDEKTTNLNVIDLSFAKRKRDPEGNYSLGTEETDPEKIPPKNGSNISSPFFPSGCSRMERKSRYCTGCNKSFYTDSSCVYDVCSKTCFREIKRKKPTLFSQIML